LGFIYAHYFERCAFTHLRTTIHITITVLAVTSIFSRLVTSCIYFPEGIVNLTVTKNECGVPLNPIKVHVHVIPYEISYVC